MPLVGLVDARGLGNTRRLLIPACHSLDQCTPGLRRGSKAGEGLRAQEQGDAQDAEWVEVGRVRRGSVEAEVG